MENAQKRTKREVEVVIVDGARAHVLCARLHTFDGLRILTSALSEKSQVYIVDETIPQEWQDLAVTTGIPLIGREVALSFVREEL